jgi:hypothetical protein
MYAMPGTHMPTFSSIFILEIHVYCVLTLPPEYSHYFEEHDVSALQEVYSKLYPSNSCVVL